MSAAVAGPAVESRQGVAGDILAVRDLAVELATRPGRGVDVEGEAAALRDALSPILAVVEASHRPRAGEPRHRSVRALAAAGIHLARAGRDVPLALGCRRAASELTTAAEMLGALR